LSVSVDIQGPDVVVPYIKDLRSLSNLFGFKIVPNGIFIDEEGTIRLIKQGFSVHNDKHVKAIEQLLTHSVEKVVLDDEYYNPSNKLTSIEQLLSETKYKLAMEYAKNKQKEKALKELDEALLIDPDNFLIRKQRWYMRYPERFSPNVDIEWQQEQLNLEKLEEAKLKEGVECGPEGCTIPGTQPSNEYFFGRRVI
jgi:tetratricopeptide (TPR) repeat protein